MKAWYIAVKDTLIRFRDRNGILLMLVAPLVLAAVSGAAFGGFSGEDASPPIRDIPVVIINHDQGEMGNTFVQVLNSGDLVDWLEPRQMTDLAEAKALAGTGEVNAVIYIPQDFTAQLRQDDAEAPVEIMVYTDPGAIYSPVIVSSIVREIANGFNTAIIAEEVSIEQAKKYQSELGSAMGRLSQVIGQAIESEMETNGAQSIRLTTVVAENPESRNLNPLAYFAPSMAVLFLMFTLFDAARSILEEEREQTLSRMISSPTQFWAILLGKIGGVFLTGVLQLAVLILASSLLFQLDWGDSPLGILLLVVAVVAAASSMGVFIVAFSRDETQAAVIGSAIALIFAILGGNFISTNAYPDWMQPLSKLTINRWALDGFTDLSLRGMTLTDILLEATVLLGIAGILFLLSLWRLPRRFVR